jgi:putative nucleotidyltransferase with HDIG domain
VTRFDVREELARIPAQPFAALSLVRLLASPEPSLAELARVVDMDPALSARVMRAANSPYYGSAKSVRSAARAVVLLGFDTVKALAAAAASGLLGEDVNFGPPDFWAHSMTVAAAASIAAGVLGVTQSDAFSAGLQHDIGAALLYRSDPGTYADAISGRSSTARLEAERDAFGIDHPEAGAMALEAWQLPQIFVRAIRTHHHPIDSVNPLAQAVILGQSVAERIDPGDPPEDGRPVDRLLDELGLAPSLGRDLRARTEAELDRIGTFVRSVA